MAWHDETDDERQLQFEEHQDGTPQGREKLMLITKKYYHDKLIII